MRGRSNREGHLWLRWVESDSGDGRAAPDGSVLRDTASDMLRSLARLGYMVELWIDKDQLRMRCLPIRSRIPDNAERPALSYSGLGVRPVLASALMDASALHNGTTQYRVSPTEHIRWVA